MITEPQIVRELSTIDQYALERLITHLLYQGAYVNIVEPNQLLETFGSNTDKQRTIKSPGHADAELRELGVYIETSADEEWVRKFKKDISKNRGNRVRIFVFCTNQNANSDETLKIKGVSVSAREYCKRELECGECFIIGRQQLAVSLRDPKFSHLRREFLKIPEEHFHSPAVFLENLRSNPGYQTCVEEASLKLHSTGFGQALAFSPKELTILYANDYITLLHALGTWAQAERESQGIISTDHCFINYPAPNASLHGVDHRELSPTVDSFLYVWGAHDIKNLSEYLKFSRTETSLIFVTKSAFKERVAEVLRSSGTTHSIRYVPIPSLEDRTVTSQEVFEHQQRLRYFMDSVPNDLMRLEALIYFYSPFYATDRALRTRMCGLMSIDDGYLSQLCDFMVRSQVAAVTGDIIWLKQPGVAKKLLNDFITDGVFAIERLV